MSDFDAWLLVPGLVSFLGFFAAVEWAVSWLVSTSKDLV